MVAMDVVELQQLTICGETKISSGGLNQARVARSGSICTWGEWRTVYPYFP
jgi:hypothetical protein